MGIESVVIDAGTIRDRSPGATLVGALGGNAKRMFDLFMALTGIVVLAPLFLMAALAVRLSSKGPVIYAHRRIGLNGRSFKCYKFRTMIQGSDARLKEILRDDPHAAKEWRANHKLKVDPRVTRLGRVLRSSSIDELPQFWNVLRGDMSIVGPRPIVAEEVSRYGEDFSTYASTRPGITGLWQVLGRSDCSYAERVGLDVQYVRSWSFWNDIVILLKTVYVVARRTGSY